MNLRLEEQQQYYKYPASGWTYKTPPDLDPEVAREMEREGLSGKYRFVWLGVDCIRSQPDQVLPEVRGDRNACRHQKRQIGFTQRGSLQIPRYVDWLEPKKLFVNTRTLSAIYYTDDDGNRVRVSRPEFAPPGRLVEFEWTYHSFGWLQWRMEELVTPEQARAVGSDDGWVSIGTIKAKNGEYAAPSILHVYDLVKRRHQDRNLEKKELIEVAKSEQAQRDEDKAWDKLIADAADEAEVKHYLITDRLPYEENRPHTR